MNIGIDGNEANTKVRVGVGQYAYNLLNSLSQQSNQDHYYIFLKNQPSSDLPPENDHWHYIVFGPKPLWTKFALPIKLLFLTRKIDIFYSPSHYSPLFSLIPTIPTIHDIGYLKSNSQFTKKDLYQLTHWTETSIRHATHIVAVSEFTKKELINTYQIPPQKISVIYNGVITPQRLSSFTSKKILNKFHIKFPYFLSVGTLKPNKNYPFLIEAFANFLKQNSAEDQKFQLVIAGKKGWLFDEIAIVVKKHNLESKVIFTDYISEKEKWSLYQNAISLIIPSTYEGFGIPAIESQKMLTPVIASNIPSLKEVLADSAMYIDPQNIKTATLAFKKILNKNTRNLLVKKGIVQSQKFTWQTSAKNLNSLFHQIIKHKNV